MSGAGLVLKSRVFSVALAAAALAGCAAGRPVSDGWPRVNSLLVAVQEGDVELVRVLLRQGAEPNAAGENSRTPFSAAIDQLYKPEKYVSPSIPYGIRDVCDVWIFAPNAQDEI